MLNGIIICPMDEQRRRKTIGRLDELRQEVLDLDADAPIKNALAPGRKSMRR